MAQYLIKCQFPLVEYFEATTVSDWMYSKYNAGYSLQQKKALDNSINQGVSSWCSKRL